MTHRWKSHPFRASDPARGRRLDNRQNRASPEGEAGLYRTIFDAAADGLIVADLETECVLEANHAACTMHGYLRDEFIGLLPAASEL